MPGASRHSGARLNLPSIRRNGIVTILATMAVCAGAWLDIPWPVSRAAAQDVPRPALPAAPPVPFVPAAPPVDGLGDQSDDSDGANLFVTDRVAMRRLRLAEERIANESYDDALELLQAILDSEEDAVALSEADGDTFYSLKGRALSHIAELPPEGRRLYEMKYGIAAASRLDDAVENGDWQAVEAISRRHFHTGAGREATWRLAIRAQDRGQSLQAALLFEKLAGTAGARFEPALSLRTVAAWTAAGFPASARAAAERLLQQNTAGLTAGGQPFPGLQSPDQLLTWIDRNGSTYGRSTQATWPMFRGDATRSATIAPVTIAGGAEWSFAFDAPTEWDLPREAAEARKLAGVLKSITEVATEAGELVQPAFSPIVAGNVAIFRTLRNIRAVDLSTGEFLWSTERPHDVTYDRAVDGISLFLRSNGQMTGQRRELFVEEYVAQSAWRNMTSGTLSTDGTYVYGIEGVGTVGGMASAPGDGSRSVIGSELFNSLYAYDIAAEGRIAWTAGGPPASEDSTGRFFLGPPLPLGGTLYALAEEQGEIRLIALDPAAETGDDRVLWTQSLVGTEAPVASNAPAFSDPLRKISGLCPSFDEGILVCPTGAGTVVGVDLGQRLLAWGYRYPRNVGARGSRAGRAAPFMRLSPLLAPNDEYERWLDAAAQTAGGRVYLTPRDSDELHCVELATGRLQWKLPRGSRLYLAAVHDGRAIVVGRRAVEAFDAATGVPLWSQALDSLEPAGRGVRSGDLYHLPLSSGEIITLSLTTGQELGRSTMGEGIDAGNLIAANGRLLSQSTRMIAGFRSLAEFEQTVQGELAENADPELLALRGEHRLHRGETEAGLADLRLAIGIADHPRAKRLLTEGLLEGLRTDFAAYRVYEDDLLKFADSPKQRLEFLRLFSAGLENAGETEAAFASYLRLVDGRRIARPLELAGQGRNVRADRTLRSRITQLYETVDEPTRTAMDRMLATSLQKVAAAGEIEPLERFANLFCNTRIGADAFALLAERYAEADDALRREQALLRLQALQPPDVTSPREPVAGERAYETFAGRFDMPYRAEFIPDEIRSGRPATDVELRFPVRVIGPRPPALVGWQIEIDAERERIQARDPAGRVRWRVPVRSPGEPGGRIRMVHDAQVRFSGHVMAFVAGTTLVVINTLPSEGPSILWTRELTEGQFFGDIAINRQQFRQMTSGLAFGPIGFAGAGLLVYQSGGTIVGADPLTGEILWQRNQIPVSCEISGDAEFVVLQPPGLNDAYIVRTVDGADPELNHGRSVEALKHFAWTGTGLVSWNKTDDSRELLCRDIARNEVRWSRSFPTTAEIEPLGSEELVVLDPPTGEFSVIEIASGRLIFSATIDAEPAASFVPLRSFGQLIIFTRSRRPPLLRQNRRGDDLANIGGPAYAFDGMGRRVWKAEIPRQQLSLDQPEALPILFLTTTVSSDGRQPSYRAAILDVRNGQMLIEQNRERSFLPFDLQVDGGSGLMTLAVRDGRFVVSPRADDPARPADAAAPTE